MEQSYLQKSRRSPVIREELEIPSQVYVAKANSDENKQALAKQFELVNDHCRRQR